MKKWQIRDARFDNLFSYLFHQYKLRFVGAFTDKSTTDILDKIDSNDFYINKCTVLQEFFTLIEK